MFKKRSEFNAILMLLAIYLSKNANCQSAQAITKKTSPSNKKNSSSSDLIIKKTCHWYGDCVDYWMSKTGHIQEDLMNVQAIIVKEQDMAGKCIHAERRTKQRHLMCAGSILNRNHVLTSATCMHKATHIRHNIQGTLAVAIAPLKPSLQVIKVSKFRVHPLHDANPYSEHHLTHNLAVLKLACRIDIENFHMIHFPTLPVAQACAEDNCIVAVYQNIQKARWAVRQVSAPHVPLASRRRKETTIEDVNEKKRKESRGATKIRSKRKLAEPPIFGNPYDAGMNEGKNGDKSGNLSALLTIENSSIEQTTRIFDWTTDNTSSTPGGLLNDFFEDSLKPIGTETRKSFVVRASGSFRSCAETGSAVMHNQTQVAIASVPCDIRMPYGKWGYTDLWGNTKWIEDILIYFNTTSTGLPKPGDHGGGSVPGRPGNYTGCSTCIFNFFIDLSCKDKNRCGNKSTIAPHKTPAEVTPNEARRTKSEAGCSSGSNGLGIQIEIGRGCDKTNDQKFDNLPSRNSDWEEPLNPLISPIINDKNVPNLGKNGEISKIRKSVAIGSLEASGDKIQGVDKTSFLQNQDISRISRTKEKILENPSAFISRNYQQSKNYNKIGESSNEIEIGNMA